MLGKGWPALASVCLQSHGRAAHLRHLPAMLLRVSSDCERRWVLGSEVTAQHGIWQFVVVISDSSVPIFLPLDIGRVEFRLILVPKQL